GLDHIGVVRSRVGSRLAAIDEQDSNNQEVSFQLAETLGTIRDVDYPSAISQLEQQLFALEAAQKTFQASRSFSLFDIL
ncbi:MAG: flagellar hook-associated protein 3, partial [Gammaproteobacteria bacterium]|nr:flagellar hook-associated protein 3 [Gammaproteobacteria bacterium]